MLCFENRKMCFISHKEEVKLRFFSVALFLSFPLILSPNEIRWFFYSALANRDFGLCFYIFIFSEFCKRNVTHKTTKVKSNGVILHR